MRILTAVLCFIVMLLPVAASAETFTFENTVTYKDQRLSLKGSNQHFAVAPGDTVREEFLLDIKTERYIECYISIIKDDKKTWEKCSISIATFSGRKIYSGKLADVAGEKMYIGKFNSRSNDGIRFDVFLPSDANFKNDDADEISNQLIFSVIDRNKMVYAGAAPQTGDDNRVYILVLSMLIAMTVVGAAALGRS